MIHIGAAAPGTLCGRDGWRLSPHFIVRHIRLATLLIEWLGCGACCAALADAFLNARRIG